ncbi:MAG: sensor histidine kinase [Gemmatimonas sp.]
MAGEPFDAQELDAIYREAPIGLALLDRDLRYLKINRALAEMNGVSPEDHIGRTIHEVVPQLAPQVEAMFRSVFETGKQVLNIELVGETAAMPGVRRAWVENISPVLKEGGDVRAALVAVVEITDQKRAEEQLRVVAERERLLMRELTHRISNGLSLVAALLDIEGRSAGPESKAAFASASDRVRRMGLIHRHLYHPDREQLVSDVADYLAGLCRELGLGLLGRDAIAVDADAGVALAADRMIPLGLIVTELITNARKHAGTDDPQIRISFRTGHGAARLTVCNLGPALPADFDPATAKGVGMKVVTSQVAQLGGVLSVQRRSEGACFDVSFPL